MSTETIACLSIEQLRELRDSPESIAERLSEVLNALRSDDEEIRAWAGDTLEAAPPLTTAQCETLARACDDANAAVAGWSCRLLGRQAATASARQSDLVACMLSHPVVSVQQQAAVALGQIPNLNAHTIEALRQASNSDDPRLSRMAQAAMEKPPSN